MQIFIILTFCLYFPCFSAYCSTEDTHKLDVVTSFSILQDLVERLGQQHVQVVNLVPRNNDAHTYQPRPSDVIAVNNADLVIYNGLGFEGWIKRLFEQPDSHATQVIASKGVTPLQHDTQVDPHAWQSFSNIRIYVDNISRALTNARPKYNDDFERYRLNYLQQLDILEKQLHQSLKSIPKQQRLVVTSHDAFAYLGREFDIQFIAPLGLSLDEEASAQDVAKVIEQIRQRKISAIFIENITSPRLLQQITTETNATIGGRLFSDALSEVNGPADGYLKMMHHNIQSLIDAFRSKTKMSPLHLSPSKGVQNAN